MSRRARYVECRVPDDQRCEALVMDMNLRPTSDRCTHYSTIRIGKRKLCVKHAGPYALQLMIKSGDAKKLPKAMEPRISHTRFAK